MFFLKFPFSFDFLNDVVLDRQSWLFTGVLANSGSTPVGFCYDIFCRVDPIVVSFSRVYYSHALILL
jgi:hypothetical protein